ncbi:Uncharacterised protein [Weissella viridescens]|uniref:Uncharacterized protein n=1 Tax=Weissella viridescens TaxID=1629 RepID=A0A380P8L4_WEIVI|nr:Uncharacterised protein [Weissella viridescens]
MTGKNGIKATAVDENDANRAKSNPPLMVRMFIRQLIQSCRHNLKHVWTYLTIRWRQIGASGGYGYPNGDIVASTQRPIIMPRRAKELVTIGK